MRFSVRSGCQIFPSVVYPGWKYKKGKVCEIKDEGIRIGARNVWIQLQGGKLEIKYIFLLVESRKIWTL